MASRLDTDREEELVGQLQELVGELLERQLHSPEEQEEDKGIRGSSAKKYWSYF